MGTMMKRGVQSCLIMQHKPYIVELSFMETQKSHDSINEGPSLTTEGPPLTNVVYCKPRSNLMFSRTSTQDSIHVHAEQAMNHTHVNKEFACTHCLLTIPP